MRHYYVYLLASRRRVLYVGISRDLYRRTYEHRHHLVAGFTKRYNVDRLVYFETHTDPHNAIAREKYVKGLLRAKKVAMIEGENPEWRDLWDELCSRLGTSS